MLTQPDADPDGHPAGVLLAYLVFYARGGSAVGTSFKGDK